jgi:teichuronic acid biosynthesis glycosyltransferase TuaC
VILVIAGDGPEGENLKPLAASLNLGNRVRFPGAVRNEDLPVYYQAADLFALASSREGWPNVLCEAQACGLPAVATDVWGIPEIVRGETLGLLVHDRSANGLRAGLEAALAREWDCDLIESVGRSRTWDRVADELEPVFLDYAS